MKETKIYIEKVEKFDSIEHEPIPFAQINRNVIQNIKNPGAALMWFYLQSMPPSWKPNKFHLMKHFDISERTYERYIAFLRDSGLVEYRQIRHKNGQLGEISLIILNGDKFNNLNQSAKNGGAEEKKKSPVDKIENPDEIRDFNRTAKKPRNGDLAAYINKQKNNKNNKTTTTPTNSEKNTKESSSDFVFSEEEDKRLLKQRDECLKEDTRLDIEYLKQCYFHVQQGEKKGYTRTQCIKGLNKIIKSGIFETPKGYKNKEATKIPKEIEEMQEREWKKRMDYLKSSKREWKKRMDYLKSNKNQVVGVYL